MKRLAGLETEYGCLTQAGMEGPPVPDRVRDHIFKERNLGLIDVHDRDYDEPAGNGGFLYNGGRVYLDMGHVEYCTAECLNLADVVGYDLAGEEILQSSLQNLGLGGEADFVKNNIDHYTGATFGCHENYLMSRDAALHQQNIESLLTFLSIRGIMTGAGRVGAVTAPRRFEKAASLSSVPYQIMQRADYIQTEIYEWVQFNRALINARDEPLADPLRFRRLHLLLGDSNVLPFTNALKIGSTALVLDLLESEQLPKVALAEPVRTMREISHLPDGPWEVQLSNGKSASALDLLEQYLDAAKSGGFDRDPDAQWTIRAWDQTLKSLRAERSRLIGKIDWITKQHLLQEFVEAEKMEWTDPWLISLDLEFHKTDLSKNLLRSLPGTSFADLDLPRADIKLNRLEIPPANTRAFVRNQLMRRHSSEPFYLVDWDYVQGGRSSYYSLEDPFSLKIPEPRPSAQ